MTQETLLDIFSSGYFITRRKIRIIPWTGDYAVMPPELHDQMSVAGSPVVIKTGNRHYRPYKESAVPSDTIALPEDAIEGFEEVLVARPGHAEHLLRG